MLREKSPQRLHLLSKTAARASSVEAATLSNALLLQTLRLPGRKRGHGNVNRDLQNLAPDSWSDLL
jgi:hypothetical protein